MHALTNLSVMTLYGLNLALRSRRKARKGRHSAGLLGVLLNLAGNAGLFIGGWLGGDLVYHHGMRVKGVSPIEEAPEWKLPNDDGIGEAVLRFEEAVAPR